MTWQLSQGTVDFRNEERLAANGRTTMPLHELPGVYRYALVKNALSQRMVDAYLPGNYETLAQVDVDGKPAFVIRGKDNAGWTLDAYIIPRLASGLIWADEIDLSHPVMKEVK